MDQNIAMEVALEVINRNNVALIGTINKKGNPNIKALTKIKNSGLSNFYFNTRIDSSKVGQMKRHPIGCVYFFDAMEHIGIMLEGNFNIIDNINIGTAEIYQALSTDTFNLCTVEFITKTVSVYKDFETKTFEI